MPLCAYCTCAPALHEVANTEPTATVATQPEPIQPQKISLTEVEQTHCQQEITTSLGELTLSSNIYL